MMRGRGGMVGRGGPVRPLFNSGPAKYVVRFYFVGVNICTTS